MQPFVDLLLVVFLILCSSFIVDIQAVNPAILETVTRDTSFHGRTLKKHSVKSTLNSLNRPSADQMTARRSLPIIKKEEEVCSICLDCIAPNDNTGPENACITELGCSHRFHKGCIDTWMKRRQTCPYCRAEFIDIKDFKKLLAAIQDKIAPLSNYIGENSGVLLFSDTETDVKQNLRATLYQLNIFTRIIKAFHLVFIDYKGRFPARYISDGERHPELYSDIVRQSVKVDGLLGEMTSSFDSIINNVESAYKEYSNARMSAHKWWVIKKLRVGTILKREKFVTKSLQALTNVRKLNYMMRKFYEALRET